MMRRVPQTRRMHLNIKKPSLETRMPELWWRAESLLLRKSRTWRGWCRTSNRRGHVNDVAQTIWSA